LGSLEREIHDKAELEDEAPLGDTVPDETLLDADTLPPVQEPEDNTVNPSSVGSPWIKKSYRDKLRKVLKKYNKQK